MLIKPQLINVVLDFNEDESHRATLKFRRMKKNVRNRLLSEQADISRQLKDDKEGENSAWLSILMLKSSEEFHSEIMRACQSVDWTGEPMFSCEDVHEQNVEEDIADAIIAAYRAAVAAIDSPEAEQKNEPKGDDSATP